MSIKTKARQRSGKRSRLDIHKNHQMSAEMAGLRAHLNERPKILQDLVPGLPALPPADERGYFPAVETARVIIARQVIIGRRAAGWTQAELAAKAGVRQETISRIETCTHSPGLKTMAKIDGALRKAGV